MKRIARALVFLFVLALPFTAAAKQRVYDYAQVFTASEKQEITDAIEAFITQTGMDYAVVTVNQELRGKTHHEIAREYYRSMGMGTGEDTSGALYYLNFHSANRQEYLFTEGKMIDYMTNARIEMALDQSNPLLREGLYMDGALAMITAVRSFVKQGIPSNQFRYDTETGVILSVNESPDAPAQMKMVQRYLIANHPEGEYRYNPETDTIYFVRIKVLTMTELLIGAGACLLIGMGFMLAVSSRYKLKGSTYRYDYLAHSGVKMTESTDQYLRTTVTRTARVQSSGGRGGGGSGFSGGGGGSGVHFGGGGGGGRGF